MTERQGGKTPLVFPFSVNILIRHCRVPVGDSATMSGKGSSKLFICTEYFTGMVCTQCVIATGTSYPNILDGTGAMLVFRTWSIKTL